MTNLPFNPRPASTTSYSLAIEDKGAHARILDRLADAELQQGHHSRAETLAWRADALRAEATL